MAPFSPFLRVNRVHEIRNCNSLSSGDVETERGGVDDNLASLGLCMYIAASFDTTFELWAPSGAEGSLTLGLG